MTIGTKLIDQLLTNYKTREDSIGENELLKELTKAILERALQAEITDHLGYDKHDPAGHHRGNTRNGKSQKTLRGDFGELELETPNPVSHFWGALQGNCPLPLHPIPKNNTWPFTQKN
jgi:putative transposase